MSCLAWTASAYSCGESKPNFPAKFLIVPLVECLKGIGFDDINRHVLGIIFSYHWC